jgi:hypothetical protein
MDDKSKVKKEIDGPLGPPPRKVGISLVIHYIVWLYAILTTVVLVFFENVREDLSSHQKYLRRNLPRLSQRSMRFSLHFISPYLDVFHLRFAELAILMWSEILL